MFRKLIGACGVLVALMLGISTQGQASVIYTHAGNNFDEFQDQISPSGTYDTTNRVTGFFEVASPLAANLGLTDISGIFLSFSFTDGLTTRTNVDTAGADTGVDPEFLFQVSTDSLGNIDSWRIQLSDIAFIDLVFGEARHIVSTRNSGLDVQDIGLTNQCTNNPPGLTCTGGIADFGRVLDSPGVWTMSEVSVPEPTTLALFATGLAGLGFMMRRRRRALIPYSVRHR